MNVTSTVVTPLWSRTVSSNVSPPLAVSLVRYFGSLWRHSSCSGPRRPRVVYATGPVMVEAPLFARWWETPRKEANRLSWGTAHQRFGGRRWVRHLGREDSRNQNGIPVEGPPYDRKKGLGLTRRSWRVDISKRIYQVNPDWKPGWVPPQAPRAVPELECVYRFGVGSRVIRG